MSYLSISAFESSAAAAHSISYELLVSTSVSHCPPVKRQDHSVISISTEENCCLIIQLLKIVKIRVTNRQTRIIVAVAQSQSIQE